MTEILHCVLYTRNIYVLDLQLRHHILYSNTCSDAFRAPVMVKHMSGDSA